MGNSDSNYFTDKIRSIARLPRYSSNEPSAGHYNDKSTNPQGSILPITEPAASNSSNPGSVNDLSRPYGPDESKRASHLVSNGITAQDHSGGSPPHSISWANANEVDDATSSNTSPPAAPPNKSQTEGSRDPALEGSEHAANPSIPKRVLAGCKRFVVHLRTAIFASWINLLLVFVPIGIAADAVKLNPSIVFALNAVAIVPLAGLLAHATETVATQLGSNIGALLNVTFGNAVELIIFIIALTKNEIAIVQASLIGSILSNLLLILGMAFLLGGLRYREQIYNNTVTQMSACLLTLSVASLVLPTAFHASFSEGSAADANLKILEVSRGTSVILLLVYILYLLFQLKSHAYMYESTPQHVIDEESYPGVLADMLNSSSSSSDSDTDGTSSDSSASHGTAGRRLRRLIKNRRRRKSSASTSTAGTVSMPSVSSPSFENREAREAYFESRNQQSSRPVSPLGVIVSGDEADADIDDSRRSAPRVRDFVSLDSETLKSGKKRHRHRHRYRHRKHRHRDDEKNGSLKDEPVNPLPATVAVVVEEAEPVASAAPKRPFTMRALSSRATNLTPGLTKMLANNVFVTPQPPVAQPLARVRSEAGVLRRTNSLPDRLNQQNMASENLQVSTNGTLPPYTIRRVPTPGRVALGEAQQEAVLEERPHLSRTAAVVMLIISTALVAVCAEFMVDAIPAMIDASPVSQAFIGLIILPIVGNAAEHVTAVTVAAKNKMDLAIGVAVGSSIQIALFVTPIVVLLGWIMDKDMSLYFNIFQTVSLFVAVLVVNFLCLDGRSNYLEGALLIAAYVIIALVAFYYPQGDAQSSLGGGYSA